MTTRIECGVWLAASKIPGGGLGMFAGRTFSKEESILATGDSVVPLIDLELYHEDDFLFLWDEYTWNSETLHMQHEGFEEVNVCSPGVGSAANSFMDIHNVDEWIPKHSYAGLHRSVDPGTGAFSPYQNRSATAKRSIEAGEEILVNYGENWFETRATKIGPIPIKGDLPKANLLLKRYNSLRRRLNGTTPGISEDLLREIWEVFVWNSPFNDTSRQFFGLPKTWNETHEALVKGLVKLRIQQHTRDLEELEQIGTCADNIRQGISTIRQAGYGAFATRNLKKGSVVAPLPLIHIPDSRCFDMYKVHSSPKGDRIIRDRGTVVGVQLMLNYCFGHNASTLLLCPYGPMTNFVNHGTTGTANVKVRWAPPKRSNHNPEWLKLSLEDLGEKTTAGLAMELVALRDIADGEEVLLDYGKEWQDAWDSHVTHWTPTAGAKSYVSAETFNRDLASPIRTEFEQMTKPYPGNVEIKCDNAFTDTAGWQRAHADGTLREWIDETEGSVKPCEILRRKLDSIAGEWRYTVLLRSYDEDDYEAPRYDGRDGGGNSSTDEPITKLTDIPRDAIAFFDRPYTADIHLPNAFRHGIRIPDEIFPSHWKNRLHEGNSPFEDDDAS